MVSVHKRATCSRGLTTVSLTWYVLAQIPHEYWNKAGSAKQHNGISGESSGEESSPRRVVCELLPCQRSFVEMEVKHVLNFACWL